MSKYTLKVPMPLHDSILDLLDLAIQAAKSGNNPQ